MSKLVTEEELEASVGDKFIGRHRLFELELYSLRHVDRELAALMKAHPEYEFRYEPNSQSEPEGFHIKWTTALT